MLYSTGLRADTWSRPGRTGNDALTECTATGRRFTALRVRKEADGETQHENQDKDRAVHSGPS